MGLVLPALAGAARPPLAAGGWLVSTFTDAMSDALRALVAAVLAPLLDLLGTVVFQTPRPSSLPAVGRLWSGSWQLVLVAYTLLITVGAVWLIIAHDLGAEGSARELLARIPAAFLVSAFSLPLATRAVDIANALSGAAVTGAGGPEDATGSMRSLVADGLGDSPPLLLVLLALVLAVVTAALLCSCAARVVITILLVGAAPLMLVTWVLPQTEAIARWWCRAFAACLGAQVAQAYVLGAAVAVFLAPGGFTLFGPVPGGAANLLAAITLMALVVVLPFRLLRAARVAARPRFLGRLPRLYLLARAVGRPHGRHRGC